MQTPWEPSVYCFNPNTLGNHFNRVLLKGRQPNNEDMILNYASK